MTQRGALLVAPSLSRWANRSTFMTIPSVMYGSFGRFFSNSWIHLIASSTSATCALRPRSPVGADRSRPNAPLPSATSNHSPSIAVTNANDAPTVANPIADQVSAFQRNVPDIVDDANASLADFQTWLDRNGIEVRVQEEGQTAFQTLGTNLSRGSGELVRVRDMVAWVRRAKGHGYRAFCYTVDVAMYTPPMIPPWLLPS